MPELNHQLNKLYSRHYRYQVQSGSYDDQSQDDFNEGRGDSSVRNHNKYVAKQKQLKQLEQKIDELKTKIYNGCNIIEHLVLKVPVTPHDFSLHTDLIIDFTKKHKKLSVHNILTKNVNNQEDVVVLVANTNSLSQEKLEALFKNEQLILTDKNWVFPVEDDED